MVECVGDEVADVCHDDGLILRVYATIPALILHICMTLLLAMPSAISKYAITNVGKRLLSEFVGYILDKTIIPV